MRFAAVFFFAAALAFAQLDSDTLSVTATHQASLSPDELVIQVSVTTDTSNKLDEVLAALSSLGLTAANFTGLYSPPATPFFAPGLIWQFTTSAPFAKTNSTLAALSALQKSITQKNPGWSLTYSIQGAQVSQQQQTAQQCPVADLITAAQAQAQKIASAAAMFVGPVLSIADTPSTTVGFVSATRSPTFIDTTGLLISAGPPVAGFGLIIGALAYGQPAAIPTQCSITVKYKLLRYQ